MNEHTQAMLLEENIIRIDELKKRLNHAAGACQDTLATPDSFVLTQREAVWIQAFQADLDDMELRCEGILEALGERFDAAEARALKAEAQAARTEEA